MKEKFPSIYKEPIETLQINIGYKCNQACKHCHVNSSPLRTEKMSNEMISLIPKIVEKYKIKTLDITGGAPELHPEFKNLITSLSTKQVDIIDRCNLTIFFEEGYEDLPQFLAKNKVIVTASLPCYKKNNVDYQRGFGVFEKSINALKILNDLGYGKKENGLQLDLVYNPVSPTLPPSQEILEKDYKKIYIYLVPMLWKNSLLVFVFFILSNKNSMASVLPIGASIFLKIKIFPSSSLSSNNSSFLVPDLPISKAG